MDITYRIEGLHCEHCAARVEKVLRKVRGVESVSIDLASKKLTIGIDGDEEKITSKAEAKLGKAEPKVRLTRL